MTYHQDRPNRRTIRLPGHDYRQAGAYFVTMCTRNRDLVLDDPVVTGIILDVWESLPDRFPTVSLDEFVVMPNHVHLVVWLQSVGVTDAGVEATRRPEMLIATDGLSGASVPSVSVPTGDEVCWTTWARPAAVQWVLPKPGKVVIAPRLGDVIGAFKSLVFAVYLDWANENAPGSRVKFWQRNYV